MTMKYQHGLTHRIDILIMFYVIIVGLIDTITLIYELNFAILDYILSDS